MASTSYKKIRQKAQDYNDKLLATDGRFRHYVYLGHIDGSTIMYESAFLMSFIEEDIKWIMCFTEHHGFHVYCADDLTFFIELKSINEVERMK